MKLFLLLTFIFPLFGLDAQSPDAQIKQALAEQTTAWNKADLPSFAATYAESCTLVGNTISEVTRADVLAHYRAKYPTPARMGHLTFSDLRIVSLDDHHAIAVARWHLDRDSTSGGSAGGVFSLVLEKQGEKWLILLDHTS